MPQTLRRAKQTFVLRKLPRGNQGVAYLGHNRMEADSGELLTSIKTAKAEGEIATQIG